MISSGVFDNIKKSMPSEVLDVFETIKDEVTGINVRESLRIKKLRKIKDQWEGEESATSDLYHPDLHGLNAEQQQVYRRLLERAHVNLVEPALDRLVNSIHSGIITRKYSATPEFDDVLKKKSHARAMRKLCENAFLFGTGYLAVLTDTEGQVSYWHPDPMRTKLAVDPFDINKVLGVFEVSGTLEGTKVIRYMAGGFYGIAIEGSEEESEFEELPLGFLPLIVAYGREQTGRKYGKSLVGSVADASIRITNNEVNLEILRDRQTQALLVIEGEPQRTSADDQESVNRYVQFPRDGGTAKYETPESRIEAVIELTKRFAADASIASGLPLDTFLPELIAGVDASATAARIRAFPLQQRMSRLVQDWEEVENNAALVLLGVIMEERGIYGGESISDLEEISSPVVKITPSLPESETETLSNWQSKTSSFFSPVEDAIEYYNPSASEELKLILAENWWAFNHPEKQKMASDAGILTVNEIRQRLGLPPIEDESSETGEMPVEFNNERDAQEVTE